MPTMELLQLPSELLGEICSWLPKQDIKSLRECSKTLNEVASPYLHQVLYLSCHPLDLKLFQLVVAHPIFVSGVRELVIDDTTLSPRLTDQTLYHVATTYEALWPGRKMPFFPGDPPFDTPEREWATKPAPEMFAMFESIHDAHHHNRREHSDLEALKEAIPRLKGLTRIAITNRTADDQPESGAQSKDSPSPTVRMWRRLGEQHRERPPFPPRCDWQSEAEMTVPIRENLCNMDRLSDQMEFLTQGIGRTDSGQPDSEIMPAIIERFERMMETDHVRGVRTISREVRILLMALEALENKHVQKTLKEFRVDASYDMLDSMYTPGLPVAVFDDRLPFAGRLANAFKSAPNLASFHLVIGTAHLYPASSNKARHRTSLSGILAAMPNLEELVLELHNMPVLSPISEDLTFDRLRSLTLSCGKMELKPFEAFLRRHSATLKKLNIEHCYFGHGRARNGWEEAAEIITQLQNQGTTHLEEVEFISVHRAGPPERCSKAREPARSGRAPGLNFLTPFKPYFWTYGDERGLYNTGGEQISPNDLGMASFPMNLLDPTREQELSSERMDAEDELGRRLMHIFQAHGALL